MEIIENGGYVYFLTDLGCMSTKIGCTNNLDRRFEEIRSNNLSVVLLMVFVVKGSWGSSWKYELVERNLHNLFDDKNIYKEWFALSKEDCINVVYHVGFDSLPETMLYRLEIAFDVGIEIDQAMRKLSEAEYIDVLEIDYDPTPHIKRLPDGRISKINKTIQRGLSKAEAQP